MCFSCKVKETLRNYYLLQQDCDATQSVNILLCVLCNAIQCIILTHCLNLCWSTEPKWYYIMSDCLSYYDFLLDICELWSGVEWRFFFCIIVMFINIGQFSYLHWRVISCCLLSVLYYEKQISIGCKQGWLRQNRSIETLIEPELACPPSVVPVLMQLHSEQGRNISLRCAVSGQW